jgi:hypothetical protein
VPYSKSICKNGVSSNFFSNFYSQLWGSEMKTIPVRFMLLLFLLSFIGCSPVSDFNQLAYDQSMSIKSQAVNLISKANENYLDHQSAIDSLKQNVEQAYQYSKTIPFNDETISQWEIIRDPGRNSLFGLLERWKSNTKLNDTFISQVKILITSDFNAIIGYENNKRKPINK